MVTQFRIPAETIDIFNLCDTSIRMDIGINFGKCFSAYYLIPITISMLVFGLILLIWNKRSKKGISKS